MEENKKKPDLRLVDIEPPVYKDPANLLRNIADAIEAGEYGELDTIGLVTWGSEGLSIHGGGKDSDLPHAITVFGAAHKRLLDIVA